MEQDHQYIDDFFNAEDMLAEYDFLETPESDFCRFSNNCTEDLIPLEPNTEHINQPNSSKEEATRKKGNPRSIRKAHDDLLNVVRPNLQIHVNGVPSYVLEDLSQCPAVDSKKLAHAYIKSSYDRMQHHRGVHLHPMLFEAYPRRLCYKIDASKPKDHEIEVIFRVLLEQYPNYIVFEHLAQKAKQGQKILASDKKAFERALQSLGSFSTPPESSRLLFNPSEDNFSYTSQDIYGMQNSKSSKTKEFFEDFTGELDQEPDIVEQLLEGF